MRIRWIMSYLLMSDITYWYMSASKHILFCNPVLLSLSLSLSLSHKSLNTTLYLSTSVSLDLNRTIDVRMIFTNFRTAWICVCFDQIRCFEIKRFWAGCCRRFTVIQVRYRKSPRDTCRIVKLKLKLTLVLTLTDTRGAVLTLMLGYRSLYITMSWQ